MQYKFKILVHHVNSITWAILFLIISTVKSSQYFLQEESLKNPYLFALIRCVLHDSHSLQIVEKEHQGKHAQYQQTRFQKKKHFRRNVRVTLSQDYFKIMLHVNMFQKHFNTG